MMKSLPYFSALLAVAAIRVTTAQNTATPYTVPEQPVAEAAPPTQVHMPSSNDLLTRSVSQLERRASVAAQMRHRVTVNGQQLFGLGSYLQQGSGDDLKVRLELQITGNEARLLQICNSRFLWIDRQLPNGRSVTRYDLRTLRTDPSLAPPDLDKLDGGKANWAPVQPLVLTRSGGLVSLLGSLIENFDFLPPQTMRLVIEPPVSAKPTSVPVYAIAGQWKPEKLAALIAKVEEAPKEGKPKKPKLSKIPERLPQEALLLIGQADLFPYRVEYRHLETPANANPDGPPIPYQLSTHPLVVLEMADVVFDAAIPAGQFDYTPGDADWLDQTATLIERLRRERREQVAARDGEQSTLPVR